MERLKEAQEFAAAAMASARDKRKIKQPKT